MRRFRPSIAQIMLLVLGVGLAIGVLRSPTPLLASALWTLLASLLCWATVISLVGRGHLRRFWVGFAVFGWVHLVLIFSSWRTGNPIPSFLPLPPSLYHYARDYLRATIPPPHAFGFITFSGSVMDFPSLEFEQVASLLLVFLVALAGGGMTHLLVPFSTSPPSTNRD